MSSSCMSDSGYLTAAHDEDAEFDPAVRGHCGRGRARWPQGLGNYLSSSEVVHGSKCGSINGRGQEHAG